MADASISAGATASSVVTAAPAAAGPDLGFDQILSRLREVVTRLEGGDLSLEQSLLIYEEGVQLARRGQQLLASAEKRVEILVSASGGVEVAPFDEPGPGPG
ncbi:MAG TPA: exodeoxyribonuclease VII small subunit [Kofleriaceae bacterium]|nr:exodeoxyribonuclease VII small subunit [Kofleriaceae bacterium]